MFEETLSEYHRLSTALASQQDITAAVDVWRDYLRHVEDSFLRSPVPRDDYGALAELQRLGGVHTSVLSGHRSLLYRQQLVRTRHSRFTMGPVRLCLV